MARRRLALSAINYIVAALIVFAFTFPIIWMAIISTQKEIWILQTPPTLKFDVKTILENYNYVMFWQSGGFIYGVRNSGIVTLISVLAALILGTPSAYALSRFKLKRNNDIAFFILSARFMPPIVIAYPIFLMIAGIGLTDTYWGLAIPYVGLNLPFVVWIMRAFFNDIPTEIDESALIDGCSRIQSLWRVMIPIALPGLVATGIFCGILTWNEMLIALHIVSTTKAATVTVMAAGSMSMERPLEWNLITSEGVFIILPMLIFSIIVQRHIVKGLTMGAIKG